MHPNRSPSSIRIRSRASAAAAGAAAALLALSVALAACAAPTPSPSPAPSASPTPTPTPTLSPTPTPDPDAPPAGWEDGGIFAASYRSAYRLLQTMTLEEKAGQVLQAKSPVVRDASVDLVARLRPGGITLFKADFQDRMKAQVVAAIDALQSASRIPLSIAVDEEGGGVVRISGNPLLAPAPFRSPHDLYLSGGIDAIVAEAKVKAALLLSLGIRLNFAPVADVSVDPDAMMHRRSLGQPAELTAAYIARYVETTRATALSSTLKHFPGYGDSADTHTGAATDARPLPAFEASDFLPFAAGIEAGVECVMVSHVIVTCLDPDRPASLSPAVYAVLRDRLGFTGVAVTDSLGMGAVSEWTGGRDPHVAALLAGADLLVTPLAEKGCAAILDAARSGDLPAEVLDRAVFRILAWKIARGIIPADSPLLD